MAGRRILIFLLCLAPVWGILQFVVWPGLQPFYSAAVAGAANGVLALTEVADRVTHLAAQGRYIHLMSDLSPGPDPPSSFDADLLHFYTVLLASVVLVFPGLGFARRAKVLGVTLAALFAFHVVALLINVEHFYASDLSAFSARHYSPRQAAIYKWLGETVDFFAVQLVPAAGLAALVFLYGGFGNKSAPPAPRARAPGRQATGGGALDARARGGRALASWKPLTIGAVALAVLTLALLHLKVPARQAEKQILLGYRSQQAGDLHAAEEHFTRAVARQPRYGAAREALGIVKLTAKRPAEAAADFRVALDLDPASTSAHYQLANALLALNDSPGARQQFEAVVALTPKDASGSFDQARALVWLGRTDEAEKILRKLTTEDPSAVGPLMNLTALLMRTQGRSCEAMPYLLRLRDMNLEPAHVDLVGRSLADLTVRCGGS